MDELDFFDDDLEIAKKTVARNLSQKKYTPLSFALSKEIRKFYESQVTIPLKGDGVPLHLKSGLILCRQYTRVVIGDYGAYVEIDPKEINLRIIRKKFWGTPPREIKYTWMVTTDEYESKVYLQHKRVEYADYREGMYYIAVEDVNIK